jgi:hypothetical protein
MCPNDFAIANHEAASRLRWEEEMGESNHHHGISDASQ